MLKLEGFNSTIYSSNKKTGVSFTPTRLARLQSFASFFFFREITICWPMRSMRVKAGVSAAMNAFLTRPSQTAAFFGRKTRYMFFPRSSVKNTQNTHCIKRQRQRKSKQEQSSHIPQKVRPQIMCVANQNKWKEEVYEKEGNGTYRCLSL